MQEMKHPWPTSEADNVKNNIQNIKDDILNEAGLTLSKDEAKQVNQDDNKILSVHASKQGSNCRSGDVLAGASNKKDLKILIKLRRSYWNGKAYKEDE